MKKFYFMNWMILLMGLISSTALGQTETITITQTSAGITQGGYDSGAERTWTQDVVSFGAKAVLKQSGQDRIQFQANNGVIYNTSPLPGKIVSISIDQTGSNVFNFFGGNTTRLVNSTPANYTVTGGTQVGSSSSTGWNASNFNETNYTFFAIKKGSGASYVSSITIEYEVATSCEASNLAFTDTTVNKDLLDPSFTQTATSLNATTAITYESSDELVATVNATTGEVTLVGIGTATITASQEAGEHSGIDYCAGTATYDVVVTSSEPVLTVSTNSASFTGFAGGAVATEDVLVEGLNLTGDIALALSGDTNFSINPTSLSSTGGTVTITYTPSATPATHSATLTVSNGALSEVITLSGVTNEMPIGPWEDFETGSKGGYAGGFVSSTAGEWYMHDALLGTAANDRKNGNQSVRLRNGYIETNFDITNGVGTVSVLHAKYGSDSNTSWQLYASTDGGATWTAYVSDVINTTSTTLTEANFTLNLSGNVRLRISKGDTQRINLDDIYITNYSSSTAVTWTGSEWINGTPSIDEDVVVEGPLVVGTDIASLEAKSLTVASNGSVVVKSGNALTVDGAIVNNATAAAFVVENDANLIQVQDVANIGEVTILRNSTPMVRNDMTLWSAPVTGQGVRAFSPETLFNRFWTYDEENYTYKKLFDSDDAADIDFATGNGYAIRVKNTLAAGTETVHEGKFIGNLNNGTYTVNVSKTGYGFNLVGNPYASSIDGIGFLLENLDNVNSVHFWTHAHAVGSAEFTNNYLTYNRAGGTDLDDLENIASGQGFFVEAAYTGSIVFNNEMRTKDEAVFHKNNIERNRIWLSLSSDNKVINNTLLAYMTGATNGIDKQMDAKSITSDNTSLYQVINNEAYSIQSRSLPFDQEDKVALGFNAVTAGTYTISIAKTDGLFAEGQAIFLVDKQTNTVHDLATPYTFQATEGVNNDRFVVVYENRTMGTNNFFNQAQVAVYNQNNQVVVEAKNNLSSVEVIDVQGRVVYAKANINGAKHIISTSAKGVLIVKATTQDGQVHTQKVIIK